MALASAFFLLAVMLLPTAKSFLDQRSRIGELRAEVAGRSVRDIAVDMVAIAKQGLKNRAKFSGGMVDERGYLSELEDIADSGITPAERLLELYHGAWQGDVKRIYADFAY